MAIIVRKDIGLYEPYERVYVRVSDVRYDKELNALGATFSVYPTKRARIMEVVRSEIERKRQSVVSPVSFDKKLAERLGIKSVEEFYKLFDPGPWTSYEWEDLYKNYMVFNGRPVQSMSIVRRDDQISDLRDKDIEDENRLKVYVYKHMRAGGIFQVAIHTPMFDEWMKDFKVDTDNTESMIRKESERHPAILKEA